MNLRHLLIIALLPIAASASYAQDGYLLFRGNPQRTGDAAKQPAWEKRDAWQRPLLKDKLDGTDDIDADDEAEMLIGQLRKNADPAVLPGAFPLIVNGVCVYRSHRDVRAVTVQRMELKFDVGPPIVVRSGEFLWKGISYDASLARTLELKTRAADGQRMIAILQASKHEHWLWSNPTIGSLSSDGVNVYAISDLVFPSIDNVKPGLVPGPPGFGQLNRFAKGNHLFAYSIKTGRLQWDTTHPSDSAKGPFFESHFLGAPLAIDQKLFALNEKADELRLVTIALDAKKWKVPSDAEIEKSLVLTKIAAAEQIQKNPLRRTQALHLAQAGDLLVCPTHAGVLVGVDRAKMAVRWTYQYRAANVPSPNHPYWQASSPIIHKDRIVFTAADAPDIHCIDLDGNKKWTKPVENGVYVATVFDDYVFVVSKGVCCALNLTDGTEKWKVEMGLPAGVGVKEGEKYYLPLQKDAIAKGGKLHRVPMPHPEALGNLALHRGLLVSQSVTHIAAFPVSER
jgi:hypothetical protein